MPEDLCYLEGKYLEDYLHDVEICQAFARRSREKMPSVSYKSPCGSILKSNLLNHYKWRFVKTRKGAHNQKNEANSIAHNQNK